LNETSACAGNTTFFFLLTFVFDTLTYTFKDIRLVHGLDKLRGV